MPETCGILDNIWNKKRHPLFDLSLKKEIQEFKREDMEKFLYLSGLFLDLPITERYRNFLLQYLSVISKFEECDVDHFEQRSILESYDAWRPSFVYLLESKEREKYLIAFYLIDESILKTEGLSKRKRFFIPNGGLKEEFGREIAEKIVNEDPSGLGFFLYDSDRCAVYQNIELDKFIKGEFLFKGRSVGESFCPIVIPLDSLTEEEQRDVSAGYSYIDGIYQEILEYGY